MQGIIGYKESALYLLKLADGLISKLANIYWVYSMSKNFYQLADMIISWLTKARYYYEWANSK